MALPTTGPLKFSDIQAEFGGVEPISLSEYYGVGGVPSSGILKLSDFYGATGAIDLTMTAGERTINDVKFTTTYRGYARTVAGTSINIGSISTNVIEGVTIKAVYNNFILLPIVVFVGDQRSFLNEFYINSVQKALDNSLEGDNPSYDSSYNETTYYFESFQFSNGVSYNLSFVLN